ncbi:MAG: MopE-related protein [Chitinophagales bacterium]
MKNQIFLFVFFIGFQQVLFTQCPDDCDYDGYSLTIAPTDCDDSDPAIHPNAHEVCNGTDDDCDALTDTDDGSFEDYTSREINWQHTYGTSNEEALWNADAISDGYIFSGSWEYGADVRFIQTDDVGVHVDEISGLNTPGVSYSIKASLFDFDINKLVVFGTIGHSAAVDDYTWFATITPNTVTDPDMIIDYQYTTTLGNDEALGLNINSIKECSDGGYFIVGSTTIVTFPNYHWDGLHANDDMYIAKLNFDGSVAWASCYGGTGSDWGNDLVVVSDEGGDDIICVGRASAGTADGDFTGATGICGLNWIIRIDGSTGAIEWQTIIGTGFNESLSSIVLSADGNSVLVTGASQETGTCGPEDGHGGYDFYVAKLAVVDGIVDWEHLFGDASGNKATDIDITSEGNYVVCGFNEDGWPESHRILVVEIDETGTLISGTTRYLGGSDDDAFGSNAPQVIPSTLGYLITTSSESNDGDVHGNHGMSDFWVVKLGQLITPGAYYPDVDGDGFGDETADRNCLDPGGAISYITDHSDCNDANALIYPGATELCDGQDNNCNESIDEFAVTAAITPSGPTSFCQGGSVTLTATPAGSYIWYKGGVAIPGAINYNYNATSAGNYTVEVTIDGGCSATSASTTVAVYLKPKAKITNLDDAYLCTAPNAGIARLKANTGVGLQYQWIRDNIILTPFPGWTTVPSYVANVAGNYKVKVKNANGCIKQSAEVTIYACRDEDKKSGNDFEVYPNPAINAFTISAQFENSIDDCSIEIYNHLGQLIYSRNIQSDKGIINETIDMNKAAEGIYMIKLKTINNESYKQLVIIK